MLLQPLLLCQRGIWFYRDEFPRKVLRKARKKMVVALNLYCFARRAAFFLTLGPLQSLSVEQTWDLTRVCLFSVSEWFYATAYIDDCDNVEAQEYVKHILCI